MGFGANANLAERQFFLKTLDQLFCRTPPPPRGLTPGWVGGGILPRGLIKKPVCHHALSPSPFVQIPKGQDAVFGGKLATLRARWEVAGNQNTGWGFLGFQFKLQAFCLISLHFGDTWDLAIFWVVRDLTALPESSICSRNCASWWCTYLEPFVLPMQVKAGLVLCMCYHGG